MTDLLDPVDAPAVITDAPDDDTTTRSKHWTAVYRVCHAGLDVGQTEQAKGSADVTAQLLDRRTHTNEAIGVFPSHKAAETAIVKEWQRRNASAA
jgi:hypothetical protein